MDLKGDIASVVSIIGEPARAVMLWNLLDGEARPAVELALYANVSAQSASSHLSKLVSSGMLSVNPRGRHRYYRIASPEVAQAVEAIVALSNKSESRPTASTRQTPELRLARSCYDHLAGRVAVEIASRLVERGLLQPTNRSFEVTENGTHWFDELEIDADRVRQSRRAFARQCLDWSERKPHIAGALGAALFNRLLELRWVARSPMPRVVRVTLEGRRALNRLLDLCV